MARVKRGVTSHAKHKKTFQAAKGFYGRRKNTIRAAKAAVDRSMQYAYRDRKNRKRTFRALWIQRLNAAVREHGLTYSVFIGGLIKANLEPTARPCRPSPSTTQLPSLRWSRRSRARSPPKPRPPERSDLIGIRKAGGNAGLFRLAARRNENEVTPDKPR